MGDNKESYLKLCSNCVLNIKSNAIPSKDGKCIFCTAFEKHRNTMFKKTKEMQDKFEQDINLIKSNRDKYTYDCLVLVSGGADSTMALYLLKKVYKLRPLAFTVDTGMLFPSSLENIKKACNILGVDWILYKLNFMKTLYRWVLKKQVEQSICRFCGPIIFDTGVKIAKLMNIPMVVSGLTKGQSDRDPAKRALWEVNEDVLNEIFTEIPEVKGRGLREDETEQYYKKHNIVFHSPWIGSEYDDKKIREILKKELNWKEEEKSYPRNSVSCMLNLLQVILLRKHKGYTLYDCEQAQLINFGEVTREEAIHILDKDIDLDVVMDVLNRLELSLEEIGLTQADLEMYSKFR